LNQTQDVLFEGAEEEGQRFGYTPNYVRVAAPSSQVTANSIIPVALTQIHAAGWMSGNLVVNP
jgi:hypothetical protein